jgi:hypothetical protein
VADAEHPGDEQRPHTRSESVFVDSEHLGRLTFQGSVPTLLRPQGPAAHS